jgi:hypothetical protein
MHRDILNSFLAALLATLGWRKNSFFVKTKKPKA